MSETITPALTPEEWAKLAAMTQAERMDAARLIIGEIPFLANVARAIATLNAVLPDDDPRKITRAKAQRLREMVSTFLDAATTSGRRAGKTEASARVVQLLDFASALESYLAPPPA